MKHVTQFIALALLVLLMAVGPAAAQSPRLPSQDAYTIPTTPNTTYNNTVLALQSSTPACNPAWISFLKWDLSGIADTTTIDTAEMMLTTQNISAVQTGSTLSLYQTGDDYSTGGAWLETGLTFNNAPALGTLIETQPAPTAAGQTVTFNSAALASYLEGEKNGDNFASFQIRVTGTCAAGTTLVTLWSKDSAGIKPDLQMYNPTAVSLSDLSGASGSAISWGYYLASLGVALVVASWMMWRRRVQSNRA